MVDYDIVRNQEVNGKRTLEYSRWCIGTDGARRFADIKHHTAGNSEDLDVMRNTVFFTPGYLSAFYPRLNFYAYSTRYGETLTSHRVRSPLYIECLGWWPLRDVTKLEGLETPICLHDVLADPRYVMLANELVDGHTCCVIARPSMDKIWMDPELGYMIRRRERRTGRYQQLYVAYHASDFRLQTEGVWLAWHWERSCFKAREQGELNESDVVEKSVLSVQLCQINHVEKDRFSLITPQGAIIQNSDTGSHVQIPGGLGFLDSLVDFTSERAIAGKTTKWQVGSTKINNGWHIAVASMLIVVSVADVVSGINVVITVLSKRNMCPWRKLFDNWE